MTYGLFIVIPVLNEEYHIETVIKQLLLIDGVSILVVDDNSSDGTVDILNEIGVEYVHNRFELGRDGCIRTGLTYYANFRSEDWIVLFDGDGQHCVSFVEHVRRQRPQKTVFKGNRFSKRSQQINTPADRLALANQLSNYLKKHYAISIEDLNCGLVGIPKQLSAWVMNNCEFDRHFPVDLCLRIKMGGSREIELSEIPVPAIYCIECPKHANLYEKLSPSIRFEKRYRSVVEKIDSIVSLTYSGR